MTERMSLDLGVIGNCVISALLDRRGRIVWGWTSAAGLGRVTEARELFESMLGCRNHVGLLSEDVDLATGELWGNFPQTYSMVGIINAATRLSRGWEEVV